MRIHDLQEQRSQAVAEMRRLADAVETRGDDYTADEERRHADLKRDITALDGKIQRAKDIAEMERSAPAVVSGRGDGAYEDRAREFSLTTAIRAAMGERVDDGRERELSAELQRRSGRAFTGIAVPDEVFLEKRTLLTSGAAADLVPNVHRGDLFIDMRRSAIMTARLGATVLDGLVGTIDIPKQTASSAAQWLAEDAALTETDANFTDVNLSPKTVGALTSYSRRTMINAVPAVEQLVRRDLAAVVARAIDYQAIFGTGTGNTPVGVVNAAGVASSTLATPSWSEVLAMIADIQNEDADIGSLNWAMNPAAVAKLRGTNKVSAEPEHGFLMTDPGNLAGYGVGTSTAIPTAAGTPDTSTVIFGAWSQLLIGRWSGLDLLVNPYGDTAYARGRVQVRAMQDVDVAVRHAESFAVADDLEV
ncbi:phage major capsid protein [Paracoccus sp. MBLB3053]|uniref:Phage major capsid protein n=1 Tax=Paracoccus aurantius TaxID=3073814 RepID=A0ABU2HUH7_9RHOB|nr:phage major capsid protein [Paracoccus sp. MBLB3053]MDS9468702.1 phage major capsid protein [Paracoccus sp. MBLB3053]